MWPWTTKPVLSRWGYIWSNSQKYIVLVKIIDISFMTLMTYDLYGFVVQCHIYKIQIRHKGLTMCCINLKKHQIEVGICIAMHRFKHICVGKNCLFIYI